MEPDSTDGAALRGETLTAATGPEEKGGPQGLLGNGAADRNPAPLRCATGAAAGKVPPAAALSRPCTGPGGCGPRSRPGPARREGPAASALQHPSPSNVATPVPQRHGPSTTRSVPKHGPSTMAPPGPCGVGGWRGEPAAPLRLVAPRTAGCGASARPGSGSGTSRRACRARAMPPHGGDFLVSGSVKRCWSLLAWQTGSCRKATNGSVSNL